METPSHPKVGDIVQSLLSGETMTIVHISSDPVFFQDAYHCAYFNTDHYLKEEFFLKKELRLIASLTSGEIETNIKNRVQLNHVLYSSGPIMEIVDIVETEFGLSAICKWQRVCKEIEVDIFSISTLRNVE